jgi:hypothetical protein
MNLRINSTASFEERGLNACWTPPLVVRALAHYEHLPQWILDPACGSGQILDALAALGHIVLGRDICDYGWPGTTSADARVGLITSVRDASRRLGWAARIIESNVCVVLLGQARALRGTTNWMVDHREFADA